MEGCQYSMWMNKKKILMSHLQAPVGDGNNNYSWEERAFAEDAVRVLGGSIWPPRSYSCTFCKREFRSAQALGGHMNIHRRDRARLKQNLSPHNEALGLDHHHKNDYNFKSSGNHFFSSQIDCCPNLYSPPSPATAITTKRLSPSRLLTISTRENCCQHTISSSPYSSSIILGKQMGSPNSEPEVVVNAKEDNFNGLGCDNYVETSLSVGLTSMFGQKSTTVSCVEDKAIISSKRLKTTFSSLPIFLKPCSNDGMEDLDLELRLGKQQKVK